MKHKSPNRILKLTVYDDMSIWPVFDTEVFNRLSVDDQELILTGILATIKEIIKRHEINKKNELTK